MRLSELQKYILLKCFDTGGKRLTRSTLTGFYANQKDVRHGNHAHVKIVTKSIERLIDKELMTGYGVRTPHKWFIKEVKLTIKGRKAAYELIAKKQQRLPLKTVLFF